DRQLAIWTEGWRAQRVEACVATRIRGEQSQALMELRVDCLDAIAIELGALIDVLGEADTEVVARTDELLERLPTPAQCADVEVLAAVEAIPAARRERYDPLLRALAAAEEQLAAGRVARARSDLDELIIAIDAEGFRGLAARARLARGRLLLELGRRDEARAEIVQAHALALAADDRRLVAQAMLQLARVVGKTSAGTDEAVRLLDTLAASIEHGHPTELGAIDLDAVRVDVLAEGDRLEEGERVARAALADTSSDDPRRVGLLNGLGVLLNYQRRHDASIEVHREAVATAERIRGTRHPAVATALVSLAAALRRDHRVDEAREILDRALAIRVAALGAQAPAVGDTHRSIGETFDVAGDLDAARREYETALAIHRAAGDAAGVVLTTAEMADTLSRLGREPESVRLLEELLPIAEAHFGAESLNVARLELNLASFLFIVSRLEPARRHGERAIALYEQLGRADSVDVAVLYLNHARVLDELSDPQEGLEMLDRAARIFAAKLPPNAIEHAHVLEARADILPALGRLLEACELRGEAVGAYDRVMGSEHPRTIVARFLHGRDLLKAGDPARARDALERAFAPLDHVAINPTYQARIRMLLAQALWPVPSERPRARELARDARERYRALTDSEFAAELDAWMAERRIR
ncbi:MAG TPA: tetratricopeptide repeat protein, partial [Nannocystaceae bacterium]|nr:tetratricopeptide repeat protein [Nannocystaceae bacterium]